MKRDDIIFLLVSGSLIWIVGTIYYAYRGPAILETTKVRYWIAFAASPLFSTALCIAILRWRQIQGAQWATAMLLLAIPGMIGEAIVLSNLSVFMPRLHAASAGKYGAFLFATYAVALGTHNAGAFSNDDDTFSKFQAGLAVSGEKFWRLPLGEEYAEQIKSDIADIKNTGGRHGGAITAAEFLHTFAEDTPWIHLDIAAMAWMEDSRAYAAKGPSGVAVRSIVEWVRNYQQQ